MTPTLGKIVTIYGATHPLFRYAVARNLASWGYRVLFVELNTESSITGVSDLLFDARDYGVFPSARPYRDMYAGGHRMKLMTAGCRYKELHEPGFFSDFYAHHNGGHLIEQFRTSLKELADFILVDSPRGVSELSGVCTIQLPDLIALLFEPGGEDHLATLRRAADARQRLPFERMVVPIIPIPTFVTDRSLADDAISLADAFADWLPRGVNPLVMLESMDGKGVAALLAHDLEHADMLLSDRQQYITKARRPQ